MAETKYGKYIFPLLYLDGYGSAPPESGRHIPIAVNKNVFEYATHHVEIFDIVRPGTTAVPGRTFILEGPTVSSKYFGRDEKKGEKRVITGAHYHVYEEMFFFIGTNPDDPNELGGEIEAYFGWGPDAEKILITKPTMILVPEGTVHPPFVYRKVNRMIKEIVVFNEAGSHYTNYAAPGWPTGYPEEILPWVNKLMKDPKRIEDMKKDKHMSKQVAVDLPYQQAIYDKEPTYPAIKPLSETKIGKYVFPLVYLQGYGAAHEESGRHVPLAVNKNVFNLASHHVEIFDIVREGTPHVPGRLMTASLGGPSVSSKYFGEGLGGNEAPKEVGKHGGHYHANSEMFFFIGTNPDDPTDLGGVVEVYLGVGDQAEKHVITKPSMVLVPPGVVHTPYVYRKVNRMMKEIVIYAEGEGHYAGHWARGGWPPGYEQEIRPWLDNLMRDPKRLADLSKDKFMR